MTEDDVRECFQDDSLLNDMKQTVSKAEKKYLFLWIAFLLIFFVIIEKISEAPIRVSDCKRSGRKMAGDSLIWKKMYWYKRKEVL